MHTTVQVWVLLRVDYHELDGSSKEIVDVYDNPESANHQAKWMNETFGYDYGTSSESYEVEQFGCLS